jgi:hypothetical protein
MRSWPAAGVNKLTTFEFTLRVNEALAEETVMGRVYARCDDCSLLVEGAVTLLMFHRAAESLQAAIRSAISDVNELGYHVSHVEMVPDSVMPQTM